jgi:hypothetical protein
MTAGAGDDDADRLQHREKRGREKEASGSLCLALV